MKAITVKQPWAELIARGEKLVENRTQVLRYRGRIAIHAGQAYDTAAEEHPLVYRALGFDRLTAPAGVVVATAELTDSHVARQGCCSSPWAAQTRVGQRPVTHLVLADVQRLADPFPARGFLGLWELAMPGEVTV